MPKKFIPNGDVDFITKAEGFARNIASDPARVYVSPAEAEELTAAVTHFRAALQAARQGERTPTKTRVKEEARFAAEQIMRRLGNVIRANPKIPASVKIGLGIPERTKKAKQLTCPQEPPRLRFVRALHEGNGAIPVHELAFSTMDFAKAKPPGAVRLELFVDLVPPEEPMPTHPGANLASRPWYLRSYTRSPIRLIPPLARVPMQVVYWGRWADSAGALGPFSATAVAWIEGGSHRRLAPAFGLGRVPVPVLEDARPPGPEGRGANYRVAVIEAQFYGYQMQDLPPQLAGPAEREVRQLEDRSAA
jgi:hypothetical protein